MTNPPATRVPGRWLLLAGLGLCVVLAGFVAFYASPHPDGLEYVAEQQGFLTTGADSPTSGSPLADYAVPGVTDRRVSVGIAGVLGALVTGLVAFGLFRLLRAGRHSDG